MARAVQYIFDLRDPESGDFKYCRLQDRDNAVEIVATQLKEKVRELALVLRCADKDWLTPPFEDGPWGLISVIAFGMTIALCLSWMVEKCTVNNG
jgi:hypothetical protein